MLGKKGKFIKHESEYQDQEETSTKRSLFQESLDGKKGFEEDITSRETISTGEENSTNKESNNDNLLQDAGSRSKIEESKEKVKENRETIGGDGGISEHNENRESLVSNVGERLCTTTDKKSKNTTLPTILISQGLKSDTQLLWDEIQNGKKGKNTGIPMGFNRLNKYLSHRKSIYTTIGATAGCGKTSLVDDAYVLNPYDWYIKNKDTSTVGFEAIYFSMERKKTYKLAKWLCSKIWKEESLLLTVEQILWNENLGKTEMDMLKFYIDNYFTEMMESGIVTILDGQQNPTGIYKYLQAHARRNGEEVEINEFEKRYIPKKDNIITNVVHDHAGKTKNENIGGKYDKKLTIDKISEYYCWARDYLGYSPVMINQFNRTSYTDIQQAKKDGEDPDPTVEYWKDSGNVIEDVDVAISLFNPYKYRLEEYMDYDISKFTDVDGANKFRGLKIIKNSYGTDNVRIGLGFLGEIGMFKEIPKANQITENDYERVVNNNYFR